MAFLARGLVGIGVGGLGGYGGNIVRQRWIVKDKPEDYTLDPSTQDLINCGWEELSEKIRSTLGIQIDTSNADYVSRLTGADTAEPVVRGAVTGFLVGAFGSASLVGTGIAGLCVGMHGRLLR